MSRSNPLQSTGSLILGSSRTSSMNLRWWCSAWCHWRYQLGRVEEALRANVVHIMAVPVVSATWRLHSSSRSQTKAEREKRLHGVLLGPLLSAVTHASLRSHRCVHTCARTVACTPVLIQMCAYLCSHRCTHMCAYSQMLKFWGWREKSWKHRIKRKTAFSQRNKNLTAMKQWSNFDKTACNEYANMFLYDFRACHT